MLDRSGLNPPSCISDAEARQLALVHEARRDEPVHAVDAEDEHLLLGLRSVAFPGVARDVAERRQRRPVLVRQSRSRVSPRYSPCSTAAVTNTPSSARAAHQMMPCVNLCRMLLVLSGAEDGLPHHEFRDLDAEQVEDGWPHVDETGPVGDDLAVGEEHSRRELVVDAVVAAPGLEVVLDDGRARLPDGRVPRRAVADVVADDEVRRARRCTGRS